MKFDFFGIFTYMVDEKMCLKRFMAKNNISFLKLRDLFLALQKDYRELMLSRYQDTCIVYERYYEIKILKVTDWPISRMVEDKESFRKMVDKFLKKGDIILNRNIPSSHYPEYFEIPFGPKGF